MTENLVNDWSFLCDKASIKSPEVPDVESFQVGEHIHVSEGWCTSAPQGQKLLEAGFSFFNIQAE